MMGDVIILCLSRGREKKKIKKERSNKNVRSAKNAWYCLVIINEIVKINTSKGGNRNGLQDCRVK